MSDLLALIRSRVIGEGAVVQTSFGPRRITYCDHAASGRAYGPIEDFVLANVLPTYGNTHTETSAVGAQTTALREEARALIKAGAGCTGDDVCIFTGNGATGAVHTLLTCMGLTRSCCDDQVADGAGPVVFVGPYEHHSNELPWRESICDVEVVDACDVDGVDLDDLDRRLLSYAGSGRRLIGSFSAVSNVTGRLTNVSAVARALHHRGAVALFDYAAAAPYVDVQMDGGGDPLAYRDAAFLSMHKFLGGPGAPGVLLAKRHLFANRAPAVPGGGTVSFVSPSAHRYAGDVEHREEGGTPNIAGSIRAGLAFQLKQSAGSALILAHERDYAARTIRALRAEPNITVLGDLGAPRLGTVSFLVSAASTSTSVPGPGAGAALPPGAGAVKFLHHNFVVALLNDFFGIQARGGNSCAAPYSHRLLGVSGAEEAALEAAVAAGWHGCKPGWTRISYGWYDSEDTLQFVVAAVSLIARCGAAFLDDYDFDPRSGTWTRRGWSPALKTLQSPAEAPPTLPESVRAGYLQEAAARAAGAHAAAAFRTTPFEDLRWFWLPGEITT